MVDRIEKLKPTEYWKLQETTEAKKDKRDQSEGEKREKQSSFEEKTDWTRLIAKESGKRETVSFLTRNIQALTFRGVSTSRDQAALEVDLLLKDGTRQESVLISVVRAQGLKLVHHKPGDSVPLQWISQDPYIKASVLIHPTLIPEVQNRTEAQKTKTESLAATKGKETQTNEGGLQGLRSQNRVQIILYAMGGVILLMAILLLLRMIF